MNLVVLALAFALLAAPASEASEPLAPTPPLKLRSKAAISEVLSAVPATTTAPFRAAREEEPGVELLPPPQADPRLQASRSSCGGERSLCYDPRTGRIVYKPARALMPEIPGLRRENISVKRNRITLRYSF
jgi:hypothetical protein